MAFRSRESDFLVIQKEQVVLNVGSRRREII
jgi:hypothetical protein